MTIRFKPTVETELIIPKIEEQEIDLLTYFGLNIDSIKPPTGEDLSNLVNTAVQSQAIQPSDSNYEWKNFTISIDLATYKSVFNVLKDALKKVQIAENYLVVAIKILTLLSSDLKSLGVLFKVVLKIIVNSLKTLIDSVASSGIYVTLIEPDIYKSKKNGPIDQLADYLKQGFGWSQFKTKVATACLNTADDPGAPQFNSVDDKVGGLVIAGLAGTGDPNAVQNLIDNFSKIMGFFNIGKEMALDPPINVRASSGLYGKDHKIGIKIKWDHPGSAIIGGFVVCRSTAYGGTYENAINVHNPRITVPIKIYKDLTKFVPCGPPLLGSVIGQPHYEYIDYDVKNGNRYYYVVYSVPIEGFIPANPINTNQDLKGRFVSKPVSAKAMGAIPVEVLNNYLTTDKDGNYIDADIYTNSKWFSTSIKDVLGPSTIKTIFTEIDKLVDKLSGFIKTGTDAMDSYLDFYKEKLNKYIKLLDEIESVIEILMNFRLKGSILVLDLVTENGGLQEGGMEGFVDRFNAATANPLAVNISGVYYGLVFIVGYPHIDKEYLKNFVPPDQMSTILSDIKGTSTAIDYISKLSTKKGDLAVKNSVSQNNPTAAITFIKQNFAGAK